LECLYRLKFDFGRTREQRLMGYMDILAATLNFCQRGGLVLVSTPEQRLKKQGARLLCWTPVQVGDFSCVSQNSLLIPCS
jgi:hypothetical protein